MLRFFIRYSSDINIVKKERDLSAYLSQNLLQLCTKLKNLLYQLSIE